MKSTIVDLQAAKFPLPWMVTVAACEEQLWILLYG